MMRMIALVLSAALLSPGCATAAASRTPVTTPQRSTSGVMDPGLMAEYVRQLPVGAKVRVSLAGGGTIRGILMNRDRDPIVVQRRARIPEAPVEIAIKDIVSVELETGGSSPARAVAIGAAAAAGATLGVLLLIAAMLSD